MSKLQIYKFGGASVRNAEGVKNIARLVQPLLEKDLFVVISAMGKITNAFEILLKEYFADQTSREQLQYIHQFHENIAADLFRPEHPIFTKIQQYISDINTFLSSNQSLNYSFVYDQVVPYGELLSTTIVSEYFALMQIPNTWLDARKIIRTSSDYREGKVNWEQTCSNLQNLPTQGIKIIQGFIGSDENYLNTTLGREGSDYTGAILAYCLDAESLTIWKDVPGVLNADPRFFEETHLLEQISYEEAIELAYYGASVIHPKTLQPLQRKKIPLYVRSFEDEMLAGSVITSGVALQPIVPCFIVKNSQTVVRVATKDFSFIDEQVLQRIFNHLSSNKLKVNLMQISAISVLLCVEDKYNLLDNALEEFTQNFVVEKQKDCSLYTIRHGEPASSHFIEKRGEILIHQQNGATLQLVIKN